VFRNLSVRNKLLTIVAAVALLFGLTVVGLGMVAKQHVVRSVGTELERSRQVISEFVASRWRQLNAGLNSLVDSPEIRAVLTTDGIDHDTQLMSIVDLQHMLNADAILYCNDKGRTLARTDDPFDEESIVTDIPMIRDALTGESSRGFWKLGDKTLLAMAFPVKQDEMVKGVVLAGVDITNDGKALESLLLRQVIVARNGEVLTSSLPADSQIDAKEFLAEPATSADSMAQVEAIPEVPMTWDKAAEHEEALATNVALTPTKGETIQAIVFVPAATVFGFYHDFRTVLLVMGAITIGLSVLVTFWIGAIISDEVRRTLNTLESVAGGDLTARLDITTRDEFGRIATALNTAIQASASTLDALAIRNRDTKMLLDAVEQGFFTIDSTGTMSDERSGAVDRMLATPKPGMTFPDFISSFDERVGGWLELGLGDVFAEILPVEVTLDQLPSRFTANGRTFSIEYTPVRIDGELRKLAIVLSDITAQVENEQLEAEQREMMAMIQRLSEDKAGFMEFFREMEDIIQALKTESKDDVSLVKRRVHTLKGNASIFGLERVAAACHTIEDYIAENGELPEDTSWTTLYGRWAAVRGYLRRVVGDKERGIDLTDKEYNDLLADVLNDRPKDEIATRLASWRLETTSKRMARIAEQAKALANRLGKGNISVRTRGGSLRMDPSQWSDFWSSFVHVVRNCVDHGLEGAGDRLMAKKTQAGTIRLSTSIDGEDFLITIADDGRGINWEKVAAAANKKGLPTDTREQLVDALFAEGVSTAAAVSATSGRGIGMGAVRDACTKLGGRIEVESKNGLGTSFHFRFPVTAMAPGTIEFLERYGVEQPERAFMGDLDSAAAMNEEFVEAQVL
jgi:HPt (histidine-containing phosphotransfer) domain-containing protein/two-component sensor histidine kinase